MAGIEWDAASTALLDEHPSAYEPIEVEVRHELRQLVNVGGD